MCLFGNGGCVLVVSCFAYWINWCVLLLPCLCCFVMIDRLELFDIVGCPVFELFLLLMLLLLRLWWFVIVV